MNRTDYFEAVRRHVHPVLREAGFRGSGATLRRIRGPVIHVFHVQGATGGDRCYVNRGVHVAPLLPPGDEAATLREPACLFRKRLERTCEPTGWWCYGRNPEEMHASASDMAERVAGDGLRFFDGLASFPDDFQAFVDGVDVELTPPGVLAGHAGLAMALGDVERCRAFVRGALARCPQRATALRARLEALIAGIDEGV